MANTTLHGCVEHMWKCEVITGLYCIFSKQKLWQTLTGDFTLCLLRHYLGCFRWVINLIYSTLFSNIPHAFRHNIMHAQNLGLSNRYALFTCSDLTSTIICHVRTHSCYGANIIARKAVAFAEPTAETAVDEVSNLSVM